MKTLHFFPAVPVGMCRCGCGRPTNIATSSDPRFGARKGEPRQFLRGHCVRGPAHKLWSNGRSTGGPYVLVCQPGHPRARPNGYVAEHVLLAEKAVGHALPPGAVVHHFDENKQNNAPGNLVVCPNESYHRLLHARMRAFAACGDPNAISCRICRSFDDQAHIVTLRAHPRVGYHRSCANAAARARNRRLAS